MLKWAVSGTEGKGSRPSSGRSTPATDEHVDSRTVDHTDGRTCIDHVDSHLGNGRVDIQVGHPQKSPFEGSHHPSRPSSANVTKTPKTIVAKQNMGKISQEVNNNVDTVDGHTNFGEKSCKPPLPQTRDHRPSSASAADFPLKDRNPFIKGSDPLYQTARGRLQARRSRLNDQINRELRLRSGAENLLKATHNRKLRETVSLELTFVNSNLQLLKEEMSDLNSSVDIYQGNNCVKCIPMIPLGLKETKDIEFIKPLQEVISEHYHENSNEYLGALEELQLLRQACRTPVRSEEGVELLFKYYNHLYFVEKRLFVPQKNIGFHFEWYDSLTGVPSCQRTVGFEKGSVLFNVGALLTQIGARQDRTQLSGLDGAVDNFQKAAGAFKYLRDHFTHAPSRDMQTPTLDMLIHLMLAQSQECLFEKQLLLGIAPGMASHIKTAHDASMVSDMYKETFMYMVMDANSQHTPTPWVSLVQAKTNYYRALAHYHAAIAVLDQADSSDVEILAENFQTLHVYSPGKRTEGSVAAHCPKDVESRQGFAKAHLRQSILSHEDALRVHNQSRQLRKIDTFQDILKSSHDRSLQKFAALEEEDDFSDLLSAPEIQPRTENAASVIPPDFSQYKVEDLLHNLGPLAIFSARHQWLPARVVEMEKADGQEFGFSVRGDSPVIIAAVEPGSRAQRGGVKVGDFIIGVGSEDTRWHKHEDTVTLIRRAGSHLILNLITPLDRSYLEGDQSQSPNASSHPPTPSMSQRAQSATREKKSHKKTGSGSSGSGWTLRRKRSSSKDKGGHHLVENGASEIHAR